MEYYEMYNTTDVTKQNGREPHTNHMVFALIGVIIFTVTIAVQSFVVVILRRLDNKKVISKTHYYQLLTIDNIATEEEWSIMKCATQLT